MIGGHPLLCILLPSSIRKRRGLHSEVRLVRLLNVDFRGASRGFCALAEAGSGSQN